MFFSAHSRFWQLCDTLLSLLLDHENRNSCCSSVLQQTTIKGKQRPWNLFEVAARTQDSTGSITKIFRERSEHTRTPTHSAQHFHVCCVWCSSFLSNANRLTYTLPALNPHKQTISSHTCFLFLFFNMYHLPCVSSIAPPCSHSLFSLSGDCWQGSQASSTLPPCSRQLQPSAVSLYLRGLSTDFLSFSHSQQPQPISHSHL